MIGGLKQMLTKGKRVRGQGKRDRLKQIIGYFERNRHRMQYDEYLALGYPIGTGAVEGTCKNLVKERMEGTGMRWTVAGAEAVLKLRSVYQSHYWSDFWNYYTMSQKSAKRVA
jgi:arginine decarboxylase-like protein